MSAFRDRAHHRFTQSRDEFPGILDLDVNVVSGEAEGLPVCEDAAVHERLEGVLNQLALGEPLERGEYVSSSWCSFGESDALSSPSHS